MRRQSAGNMAESDTSRRCQNVCTRIKGRGGNYDDKSS